MKIFNVLFIVIVVSGQISYSQVVDPASCVGMVDGLVKYIDLKTKIESDQKLTTMPFDFSKSAFTHQQLSLKPNATFLEAITKIAERHRVSTIEICKNEGAKEILEKIISEQSAASDDATARLTDLSSDLGKKK